MTWLTIVGAVITALLPLVIKLIDRELDSGPTTVEALEVKARENFNDLASKIHDGNALGVAAVWSKHDRLLFQHGLGPGRARDGSRRLGNLPESGRYVDRQRSVDAASARVRTGVDDRAREMSRAKPVIPLL